MRFRDCEIIADQNIHEDVVAWLFSQGISVRPLAQMLDREAPDDAIAELAGGSSLVVLTHHHDFGLLMESGVRVVVAFVRPGHFPPAKTISQLERILDSEVAVDAGVLVVSGVGDSLKIRVRARRSPSG